MVEVRDRDPRSTDLLTARLLESGAVKLAVTSDDVQELAERLYLIKVEFARFTLFYQGGIEEISTKLSILRQEFECTHDYSPIEHVRSRLKTPESMADKAMKIGCELTIPALRDRIRDIAGIRITCSFTSDVYWVADMLSQQPDITVVQTKDYIANPKPNGYRSLHLIVQVPVYLSDRTENVFVEIQIRTIAMDFWASLEHDLAYKLPKEKAGKLIDELKECADVINQTDERMQKLFNILIT